jgi:hypothetical protein
MNARVSAQGERGCRHVAMNTAAGPSLTEPNCRRIGMLVSMATKRIGNEYGGGFHLDRMSVLSMRKGFKVEIIFEHTK